MQSFDSAITPDLTQEVIKYALGIAAVFVLLGLAVYSKVRILISDLQVSIVNKIKPDLEQQAREKSSRVHSRLDDFLKGIHTGDLEREKRFSTIETQIGFHKNAVEGINSRLDRLETRFSEDFDALKGELHETRVEILKRLP